MAMYDYKLVKQVSRKKKAGTGFLKGIMIALAVLFVLLGIVFSRGFMLPGFLMAGLYFVYEAYSQKDYEYRLEGNELTIDVITGKRRRKEAHVLNLNDLEVVAPNWHDAVARYRKNGGSEKLPKYDYTSYEPDVPYYTMIIVEDRKKIKLLLDLDEEFLRAIRSRYPEKVFLDK